ncbi:MAG TPA: 30S ribosomal protein S20 [Candidatus Saccharimonadales bacterium]|nr:30S ribosomal protein S20 [Candidatus Saccharimonadales bacterium]
MPIIKSAKKRVRVSRKATVRNVKTKRSIKTALKAFQAKSTDDNRRQVQSALDKAGKKNVMHKNKVARKQRQLAAQAKAAGVKIGKVAKKPVSAKPKPSVKKTTIKKPATKKAPAKKK